MKHLYLIRHAKSSWSDPSLSDFDRPLNKRGKRDLPVMGARLTGYAPRPELIVSSPARRARRTARGIGAALGFAKQEIALDDDLYTFSPDGFFEVIKKTPAQIDVLALVGHNPALTECAEMLCDESLVNVPTCGIVLISFALTSWDQVAPGGGTLLLFDYPKKQPGEI